MYHPVATVRPWRVLAVCVLLLLGSGCGLLDVNTPDIIDPGDLDTPEGAQAKRVGAISDFAFAKEGDGAGALTDGYVLLSGAMADEFLFSSTPPTTQEIDQRKISENNVTLFGLYFQLHRARSAAEAAVRALEMAVVDPDADTGIPELFSLAGFTYTYFGEGFCSGVPFSRVSGDSLIFGESITTAATYDTAIARFDSALAHPAVSSDVNIENLAHVGRARVLLDQGLFAAAAAEVASVPTDFEYDTEHATTPIALNNAIFANSDGGLYSIPDAEGGSGIAWLSIDDPRVPFFDTEDVGLDGSTPQVNQLKYSDFSAPVPVANGTEARLIEAEAQLQAGDTASMLTILNTLRTDAGLSALTGPSTITEAEDMLFNERAFWLYATGHRLGDLRRLIRQYGRSAASVFPTGPYLKGGNYGTDVNLPIPAEEFNNPNFSGCIDRNP
ncbi:MAG: RagB/SusD family nutrient uptake outer membrane protein [Gemmatimonadota bacterium]